MNETTSSDVVTRERRTRDAEHNRLRNAIDQRLLWHARAGGAGMTLEEVHERVSTSRYGLDSTRSRLQELADEGKAHKVVVDQVARWRHGSGTEPETTTADRVLEALRRWPTWAELEATIGLKGFDLGEITTPLEREKKLVRRTTFRAPGQMAWLPAADAPKALSARELEVLLHLEALPTSTDPVLVLRGQATDPEGWTSVTAARERLQFTSSAWSYVTGGQALGAETRAHALGGPLIERRGATTNAQVRISTWARGLLAELRERRLLFIDPPETAPAAAGAAEGLSAPPPPVGETPDVAGDGLVQPPPLDPPRVDTVAAGDSNLSGREGTDEDGVAGGDPAPDFESFVGMLRDPDMMKAAMEAASAAFASSEVRVLPATSFTESVAVREGPVAAEPVRDALAEAARRLLHPEARFSPAEREHPGPFLVEVKPEWRSGRGRWWRAEGAGYTDLISEAGVYGEGQSRPAPAPSETCHLVALDQVVETVSSLASRLKATLAPPASEAGASTATIDQVERWASWTPDFDGFVLHDTREAAERFAVAGFEEDLRDNGEDRLEDSRGLVLEVVGHVESIRQDFEDVKDEELRAKMEQEGWSYLVEGYRIAPGSGVVRRSPRRPVSDSNPPARAGEGTAEVIDAAFAAYEAATLAGEADDAEVSDGNYDEAVARHLVEAHPEVYLEADPRVAARQEDLDVEDFDGNSAEASTAPEGNSHKSVADELFDVPPEFIWVRRCVLCGCTDHQACVEADGETPCYWFPASNTTADVCSACVELLMLDAGVGPVSFDALRVEVVGAVDVVRAQVVGIRNDLVEEATRAGREGAQLLAAMLATDLGKLGASLAALEQRLGVVDELARRVELLGVQVDRVERHVEELRARPPVAEAVRRFLEVS